MKFLLILILFVTTLSFSQNRKELTSEERAYLYHTVKNSPIFNNHFGKYFNYVGPKIVFPNKEVDYDSLENYITQYPDSLIIYTTEIRKAPKGLVIEAANKLALWELNRILMAKRGTPTELEPFKDDYEVFAQFLIKNLPPQALTKIDDQLYIPHPKLDNVLNPMLTFDDKTAMLGSYQFLTPNDQLVTINAISKSINEYIQQRTKEIYEGLYGSYSVFDNDLIAAGDGTISSQTFEDRESNEKSKWVNGLPKTFGLIPYQSKYSIGTGAISSKIDPLTFPSIDYTTVGDNKTTNLHIDVWAYNPEKQVTVIIEKNGLCYPLFNSGKSRFLSPDSTFAFNNSFKSKIDQLELVKIKDLNEMIYGKKGFDHWIKYNNKQKDKTELKITKLEKKFSDFGYSPIGVSKKKSKQKVARNKNDRDKLADYNLSSHPEEDERYKTQDEIVRLHKVYDEYKKKIRELEIEKKQALELLALYYRRLDDYKQAFGVKWAKYKLIDGKYVFEDSSIFNIKTQDFKFPERPMAEPFEVRLISIPEDCLSNTFDEVMVHVNMVDEVKDYDANLNIQFPLNSWRKDAQLLNNNDSIALNEIFDAILKKNLKFKITALAGGIGKWDGSKVIKDRKPLLGSTKTNIDSNYLKLRSSELIVKVGKEIEINTSSFTDGNNNDLKLENLENTNLVEQYKLTNQEIITLYRTASILNKFKTELISSAKHYLSEEDSKRIERKINKEWLKVKVSVGKVKIKLNDLK